jgi:tyrosyl-tRNA synthetase
MADNVITCLQKRGFIDQLSSDKLEKVMGEPINFYVGFDPTADSLHIGHLVGIMALSWLQRYGHKPIAMVGGATGRIGDPSGKSKERPFLDDTIIEDNSAAITSFLKKILSKGDFEIINNNDWFSKIYLIDFLRDIGKNFRMGTMLAKDSVRTRLNSDEGMSLTEFSYQLLQAYDFNYLFTTKNVKLQMGGSDQWGNITAGIDLVRRLHKEEVYGITFPLLTGVDGKKFGKTEKGAIWLSPTRLSPYEFYQYLFKTPDADVIKLLKMLTFIDIEEINAIEKSMTSKEYAANTAQKILAQEVVVFIHGEEGLKTALEVTKAAQPGGVTTLDKNVLESIMHDMPHTILKYDEVVDKKYVEVIVKTKLATSKSEAVRLIKNGGVYLNNHRVVDINYVVLEKDLIDKMYLLIGIGKKKKLLIKIA